MVASLLSDVKALLLLQLAVLLGVAPHLGDKVNSLPNKQQGVFSEIPNRPQLMRLAEIHLVGRFFSIFSITFSIKTGSTANKPLFGTQPATQPTTGFGIFGGGQQQQQQQNTQQPSQTQQPSLFGGGTGLFGNQQPQQQQGAQTTNPCIFFHLSMFSDFSDPWPKYLVVQLPSRKEAQACLETACSATTSNKTSSNLLRRGHWGYLVAIKPLPLRDHSRLGSTNNKMRLSRLNPFSETLLGNKISNQL